jgi:proline dehydrogenase
MSWFHSLIAQTLPIVPKPIVRRVSARYVAGERIEDAVATVRTLNVQGMMTTLDVLGEFVSTEEEARRGGIQYHELLRTIEREKLDSNISLKLTQMGLKIDLDLCHEIVRGIVEEAARHGNFVRIDMEDSSCTDDTLAVYERVRQEFPGNVGCVLQAYLKRTLGDAQSLAARKANVRLCKGIYIEPARIAYKGHDEVNRRFLEQLDALLRGGAYVGIATHDHELVEGAYKLIADLKLDPSRYEFQMLLGVTERLRASILERGHRLRVYVPFGSHWYPYSLRRLKENPEVAGHIIKNMFNGRS